MIFAVSAAVLGATTLWILAPLFGRGDSASEPHDPAASERDDLLKTRQERLGAIKDLEMEYRVGKLTKEDFEETRETLAREAVEVLRQIDESDARAPGPHGAPHSGKPSGKHGR